MNTTPRSPIVTNTRGHPPEFQQLIREKSENFVGREFVFAAINEFLHKNAHGYFTLIGAPGSGKSAILAKYVTENPHVIYYNAQVEGKNRADEFLSDICNQLINQYSPLTPNPSPTRREGSNLPDHATEGSWFLSLLLQKISDNLEPNQRLIIAIDALDAIDPNSQSANSNLFYLPRYLPQKVYFLLTRRPFVRERSRLLIEAPSQVLDLGDYPEQNRDDVRVYIRQCLTPLTPLGKGGTRIEEGMAMEESSDRNSPPFLRGAGGDLKSWLITHNISEQEFSARLTAQSENNFMYLSQILQAIAEGGRSAASIAQGFDSESFEFEQLPPSLEEYYQSHLQKMQSQDLSAVELGVLRCLTTTQANLDSPLKNQGLSVEAIAQILDEDEYEVEEVLEKWIEFLHQHYIDEEVHYSLYHSSFRDWLSRQIR
jgi:hypothetical protein